MSHKLLRIGCLVVGLAALAMCTPALRPAPPAAAPGEAAEGEKPFVAKQVRFGARSQALVTGGDLNTELGRGPVRFENGAFTAVEREEPTDASFRPTDPRHFMTNVVVEVADDWADRRASYHVTVSRGRIIDPAAVVRGWWGARASSMRNEFSGMCGDPEDRPFGELASLLTGRSGPMNTDFGSLGGFCLQVAGAEQSVMGRCTQTWWPVTLRLEGDRRETVRWSACAQAPIASKGFAGGQPTMIAGAVFADNDNGDAAADQELCSQAARHWRGSWIGFDKAVAVSCVVFGAEQASIDPPRAAYMLRRAEDGRWQGPNRISS